MILGLIDEAVARGAAQRAACDLLGLDARTVQRWRTQGIGSDRRVGPRSAPANRLSAAERRKVVDVACSKEFRDMSPKQIVPILAERGAYVGSEATIYRVLHDEGLLRRRGHTKPPTPRPRPTSKAATATCQLWSWDITYVPGPVRGQFLNLYVVMDVWSRKIVGHAMHATESAEDAAVLIERTCTREGITRDQVTLHSDNGGPMKGATMLATLQRLGVATSFSRPRVSDDNPYSESLFRTAKYWPQAPVRRFESLEAAAAWAERFVRWYNHEHRHSGIQFVTPADRHDGRHIEILEQRRRVLEDARRRHPERWTGPVRSLDPITVVTLHPDPDHAAELAAA